jgi:hypothetical protein
MFLVGGLCRGGLNAREAGNIDAANKWGAAAASMVFLYTFVFGATWLTVPWYVESSYEVLNTHIKPLTFAKICEVVEGFGSVLNILLESLRRSLVLNMSLTPLQVISC